MINRITKSLLSLGIIAACMAIIPAAARVGLLILSINPNPRHPPSVMFGEAMGWSIFGAITGAVVVLVIESIMIQERTGIFSSHRGLLLGSLLAVALGAFWGIGLAVVQMQSVDGQAITSLWLGLSAGTAVGALGAIAGIGIGATVKRWIGSFYDLPPGFSSDRRITSGRQQ